MSAMPSLSARRPRTKAKKVVLYVPDTFDPEVHLPQDLRHLGDYARYLLHRINVGRVHLRRGNCLIYLKHDYLARYMPRGRLTRIRDALEDAGVIHVRKFCVPGEMCYGYRLLPPHDQGFSHYQPTIKRLVTRIMRWRAREFREIRLPLHRDLRRFVRAITIDQEGALAAVQGNAFQRSAQIAMVRSIANRDFFTVVDRFGRFHTNLTNLKATLRPFLRYRGSPLVNLDIANSQPMVFCLLLVNLLSNDGKIGNLIDYSFPETSGPYCIEVDQGYLDSLSYWDSQDYQEGGNQEEGEEGSRDSPILHANIQNSEHNILQEDNLQRANNRQTSPSEGNHQEEEEGGDRDSPILHANEQNNGYNMLQEDNLQRPNNRQALAQDVIEFIDLCEQGILYDDLMRRLGIPAQRRKGFKRLIFSQVFFGKNQQTGQLRDLFARDFPTVYQVIHDLKRKDYRQLAYLLQAHESKIMIDIICRRILKELPGTFVGTIHDSILTTPDKAEEIKAIMMREFQRFGLRPTIRMEAY
jgi:hypothetical protein